MRRHLWRESLSDDSIAHVQANAGVEYLETTGRNSDTSLGGEMNGHVQDASSSGRDFGYQVILDSLVELKNGIQLSSVATSLARWCMIGKSSIFVVFYVNL